MWLSCVCAGLALLWARISGAAFGSPGSGAPPRLLAALRRAVLTVSPLAQHLPVGARGRYCGYLVSALGWLCFGYAFLVLLLLAWFRGPPPAARASSSRTDRVATCATPASWCLHAIQTRMAAYHSVAVSAAVLVTAFEC